MDLLSEFLIWSIAVFGIVNGIVVSALLRPFREWVTYSEINRNEKDEIVSATYRKEQFWSKLIHCPMCLGFWIGGLFSVMVWSPSGNMIGLTLLSNHITNTIFDCAVGSMTCWLLYITIYNKQMGK